MNIFFVPDPEDDYAALNSTESHHCAKVLRMQVGDEISFIDGKGTLGKGILQEVNAARCEIKIIEKQENFEKRPYYLHIAIAPTKSIDRFEWFLEKSVEIGIDRITPLICEHSERRKIRLDRMERIILSAAKQSIKASLPHIDSPVPYADFLSSEITERNKFIAHCRKSRSELLLKSAQPASRILLLIGPEGDFSEKEIELAAGKGFKEISLGNSRLRTETAGVVAAQICADLQII